MNGVAQILKDESWALTPMATFEAVVVALLGTSSERSIPPSVVESLSEVMSGKFGAIFDPHSEEMRSLISESFEGLVGFLGEPESTDLSMQERLISADNEAIDRAVWLAQALASYSAKKDSGLISVGTKQILESVFSDPNWQALILGFFAIHASIIEESLILNFATIFSDLTTEKVRL